MNSIYLFFFINPSCPYCTDMLPVVESLYVYDSLNVRAVVDSTHLSIIKDGWDFSYPIIPDRPNMKEKWNILSTPKMVTYFKKTNHAYIVAEGLTHSEKIKNNLAKALYLETLFRNLSGLDSLQVIPTTETDSQVNPDCFDR